MSTITMDSAEHGEMLAALQQSHRETAELRKLLEARLDENTFWIAAKAATEVIKFTMANFSPEASHGWPGASLKAFADYIIAAPGANVDIQSWAHDALEFAKEAEIWDGKRDRAAELVRHKLKLEADHAAKVKADAEAEATRVLAEAAVPVPRKGWFGSRK